MPFSLLSPTAMPFSLLSPTAMPFSLLSPTAMPFTLLSPTAMPFSLLSPTVMPFSLLSPTAMPFSLLSPTAMPFSLLSPTAMPFSLLSPTVMPFSLLSPTAMPFSLLSPTAMPFSLLSPTVMPFSLLSPTAMPFSLLSPTAMPFSLLSPTAMPFSLLSPSIPLSSPPPSGLNIMAEHLSQSELDYPFKLLEYFNGFRVSKVIFSACELGVFDLLLLSQKPLSAELVAQELGASVDGIERLLDVLVGVDILEVEQIDGTACYSSTDVANLYLAKGSAKSLHDMIIYQSQTIYPLWNNMVHAVREGKNQNEKTFGISPEDIFQTIYR
eukprot:XP_014067093.1 PREDICTED: hepatitis A virus cellular receptor 1-like [Salmo salar]